MEGIDSVTTRITGNGNIAAQKDSNVIQAQRDVVYINNLTLNLKSGLVLSAEKETLIRMLRRKRKRKTVLHQVIKDVALLE